MRLKCDFVQVKDITTVVSAKDNKKLGQIQALQQDESQLRFEHHRWQDPEFSL